MAAGAAVGVETLCVARDRKRERRVEIIGIIMVIITIISIINLMIIPIMIMGIRIECRSQLQQL